MAKAKKSDDQAPRARALVDLPQFDVRSGGVFTADAAQIEALVKAGAADDHPDAISAGDQGRAA